MNDAVIESVKNALPKISRDIEQVEHYFKLGMLTLDEYRTHLESLSRDVARMSVRLDCALKDDGD